MCPKPRSDTLDGSADSSAPPRTVRDFCLRILEQGDLQTKLTPPSSGDSPSLLDPEGVKAISIERPSRDPGLRMRGGGERLPRPGKLRDLENRRRCLSRFAHHELMAVELFAWALLRWPDLPRSLRRGWLSALADEQRHCRLYLERLHANGGCFESDDHSDYFWRQASAIAESPAGPCAFLAGMGLTLEQANLDFTLTYRDGFAQAGDEASARVCQIVHDEEIAHVALAAHWIGRLELRTPDAPDSASEEKVLDRYLASVPFPLGPARAKGRRFEAEPRRRAGLSPRFIETIQQARSSQERKPVAHPAAPAGPTPESASTETIGEVTREEE